MARHIGADHNGFVYRAVVDEKSGEHEFTYTYGPYTNAGTAKSQITRETRWGRSRGRQVEGRVQRARIEWEDMA